jgi:hypothetical protein
VAPPPGSGELQSRHVPHSPGSRLLAQGNSGAVMGLMVPAPATGPWGSSGTATCLMAPALAPRPRGNSGTAMCPLGSSSRLLA